MSITSNNLKVREVIHQVVNDPEYKAVSSVPLFSWPQIGLITFAWLGVFGSIGLHLSYDIPIWYFYPVMIFAFYSAFTPLHDATHRAVSSNVFLNDLLGTISGTLLLPFATTGIYRFLHLSHHRYVGDEEWDPDDGLVVIPKKYFPFGFLILLFPDVLWAYWLFFKGWKRAPLLRRISITAMLAGLFLFNIAWFASPYWYEYLVLFFIPNRLGIGWVAYAFAHIQHPEGVKWNEHPIQTTFSLRGNRFLLSSLWGQAHHAMHHFMPHVPWFKYRDVWKLANGAFRKQGVPERRVFKDPGKAYTQALIDKEIAQTGTRLKVKVVSVKAVASNVKHFIFELADKQGALPEYSAGSHIHVYLPSGLHRTYSLINPSHDSDRYHIAVRLDANSRGGSKELHESVKEGTVLEISRPVNNFVLYENASKFLLIAGGIGITPLISMAHRLDELDKHFELHITSRTEEEVPFLYELEHWPFAPNVEIHLDRDGRPSLDLEKVLAVADDDTLIYVCGPQGFNQWVIDTAQDLGWQRSRIKQEVFRIDTSGLSPAKPFEVVLSKRGKTLQVPKEQTIIDALQHNNISVPYSCLQGTCGTCVMEVQEGEIDHRDAVLTEEEKQANKKICLCVSRAAGNRLVIDL